MGCKYHGWSYDTTGKLIKAPAMDAVEGFNKEEYPLFAIHTYVTSQGLIFVNFDAEEAPAVKFEDWFQGLESEMKDWPFDEYELYIPLLCGLMGVIRVMRWKENLIGRL